MFKQYKPSPATFTACKHAPLEVKNWRLLQTQSIFFLKIDVPFFDLYKPFIHAFQILLPCIHSFHPLSTISVIFLDEIIMQQVLPSVHPCFHQGGMNMVKHPTPWPPLWGKNVLWQHLQSIAATLPGNESWNHLWFLKGWVMLPPTVALKWQLDNFQFYIETWSWHVFKIFQNNQTVLFRTVGMMYFVWPRLQREKASLS